MPSPDLPLIVVQPLQPLISLSDDAGRRLAERGLAMLRHYKGFADFADANLIVDSPVIRLRRLISQGESDAAFDLALEIGRGEDPVAAMEALGVMLRIGRSDDGFYAARVAGQYNIGLPPFGRNWPESAKWATLSANKGCAHGEDLLAWFYSIGRGVPQDNTAAIHFAQRAINQSSSFSLKLAAFSYWRGTAISPDLPRAHAYLTLHASLRGNFMDEEAKGVLRDLEHRLDPAALETSEEIQRSFHDIHRLTAPYDYPDTTRS